MNASALRFYEERGCLSLDRCRLRNPGDRAAGLGAGARYVLGDDEKGPLSRSS